MPLFDFRCRACGSTFEALLRPSHKPACPSCASSDLDRQPSFSSVSVKSGGGLSKAARIAVQTQQRQQHRDQAAYQQEIEKKHLDD
ncbi:MAG TPA: zinc ribbon domain-containing protein [Vicinamibacterales bacterium]